MLLFFPFTLLEKEKLMLEYGFAQPSVAYPRLADIISGVVRNYCIFSL